jgi:drug/metabolite transporter (DMT)-like permease
MRRLQADLLLLLAAAIWGVAFYFQKTAMAHIGPFLFIAARGLIAATCLLPLAFVEHRRVRIPWSMGLVKIGLAGGVAFLAGAALQQTGMVTATVTNAGFLTGLYVVATPIVSWLLFKRRPENYVWPAVALAFVGIWLLGGGTLSGFSFGDMLIALSSLVWAVHMLITSLATPYGRPVAYTAMQFASVGTGAVVLTILFEQNTFEGFLNALPSIAYVGVLSSAVTFTLLAIALKATPPTEASILMSMEMLFAAAAGVVLLGEWLPPIGWLGAALMFSATLLVQIGPMLKKHRTETL